jgi:hypothetical protein
MGAADPNSPAHLITTDNAYRRGDIMFKLPPHAGPRHPPEPAESSPVVATSSADKFPFNVSPGPRTASRSRRPHIPGTHLEQED